MKYKRLNDGKCNTRSFFFVANWASTRHRNPTPVFQCSQVIIQLTSRLGIVAVVNSVNEDVLLTPGSCH